MNNYKLLSKSGGVLVLLGVLLLPIGGCGGEHINGIQAMDSNMVPQNLKLFIGLVIFFGVLILILTEPTAAMTASVFGMICLFVAHYCVYKAMASIMMLLGSVVAVIGFTVTWTANFLKYNDSKG